MFARFSIKSPVTGNSLSAPMDFNLMFKTSIGPGGALTGSATPTPMNIISKPQLFLSVQVSEARDGAGNLCQFQETPRVQ